MNSLEKRIIGTAITNLGDLKFPEKFGSLELKSVIMNPGGAFPLVMVELVAAIITTSGRMTILIEYVENQFSESQVEEIKKNIIKLLEVKK
jgi:hypothetical protein